MKDYNIISAVYGTTNNGFDVATVCRNLVGPTIDVNNKTFKDPDPGVKKRFGIKYSDRNGDIYEKACHENETLDLTPTSSSLRISSSAPVFTVLTAIYGTSTGASRDVTDICNSIIANIPDGGDVNITVNDTAFGDPSPGHSKSFSILYQDDNGQYQRACSEGETLTLTAQ